MQLVIFAPKFANSNLKKIRVFVEGHWFDEPFQSPCAYLYGLYSRLSADRDFEVFLAARYPEKAEAFFNGNDKITYLRYNASSKFYRLAVDIPSMIERHKISIAHYQYVSPLTKKSRELVTLHDLLFKDFTDYFPWTYRWSKNALFYFSAKKADLVTTVSNYSADAIRRHYRIDDRKLFVTPNGVSEKFLSPHAAAKDVKSKYGLKAYILCVSRIEPRKNHIQLLKAYVELELWRKNIQLVFIGRKDIPVAEMDHYIERMPDEAKKNFFHFTGISEDELIAFYQGASLFVYPSIGEGFGIPPLEAAAVKTKVLCSNATAMSDFDFFGEDLFDPNDKETLKRKIVSKLHEQNPYRLTEIANVVDKKYNWDTIAEAFGNRMKALVNY